MANALIDVQSTYLSLDAQYNMLLTNCTTQDQKNALSAQYSTALQNYQSTLNATLGDDDAQVATLSAQLKDANTQVVHATAQMGDMGKVINDITTAVTLGSHLVAMV